MYIYTIVGHNFGLAIILFTILIKLVTHPLTAQQVKGSKGMQALQSDKRWIEAQKKYKDDKEKLIPGTDEVVQRTWDQSFCSLPSNDHPISDHHWAVSKHHGRIGFISDRTA